MHRPAARRSPGCGGKRLPHNKRLPPWPRNTISPPDVSHPSGRSSGQSRPICRYRSPCRCSRRLARLEPLAMRGQPPIVWDRAEGFQVWDAWGNCWIDWSSGVLITNAGHGRAEIRDAIGRQARSEAAHHLLLPARDRACACSNASPACCPSRSRRSSCSPRARKPSSAPSSCAAPGACARAAAPSTSSSLSPTRFTAARSVRSRPAARPHSRNGSSISIPASCRSRFPDGIWSDDTWASIPSSGSCMNSGVEPQNVAGVILETYQGGTAAFAPRAYMQALQPVVHGAQSAVGLRRSAGRLRPHRNACGASSTTASCRTSLPSAKAFRRSLPLSAVAGRADVMDQFPPGAMTSTHTGNPVCCAAALASLDLILKENLVENARAMGEILHARLRRDSRRATPQFGFLAGKGLVAGLVCVHPGTRKPDGEFAWEVVRRCDREGRPDVQPGRLRGLHRQDRAAAGDHEGGPRRQPRRIRRGRSAKPPPRRKRRRQ